MTTQQFLFDPVAVSQLLGALPDLRATLADAHEEGEPSSAFPVARKSAREIYRVLGNEHYPNLKALLHALDHCLSRGFRQPRILRTRGHETFASVLAELSFAHHFLLRGFAVECLDVTKDSKPVPDFVIRRGGYKLAVEVYSPAEWMGSNELMNELKDSLKNLDVPFDYRFAVRVEQIAYFDKQGRLIQLHPEKVARGLEKANTSDLIIEPLIDEIEMRLRGGDRQPCVQRCELEHNIRILIEITNVGESKTRLPERCGTLSPLSPSGYAPEAMFDRLVDSRVRKKDAKAQAPQSSLADHSLLVVDLACAGLTAELCHELYRKKFEETARKQLEELRLRYDLIAFCEPTTWGGEVQLHFAIGGKSLGDNLREALFGTLRASG